MGGKWNSGESLTGEPGRPLAEEKEGFFKMPTIENRQTTVVLNILSYHHKLTFGSDIARTRLVKGRRRMMNFDWHFDGVGKVGE